MNRYNSAKLILDFYMEKLSEDTENINAYYAMHFADLHLLRLHTSSILDSLESYTIEAD